MTKIIHHVSGGISFIDHCAIDPHTQEKILKLHGEQSVHLMVPTLMVFGKDTKAMMQTCFRGQYNFMSNLTNEDPNKISILAIGDKWPVLTNFDWSLPGDMKNGWAIMQKGGCSGNCENPCQYCDVKHKELDLANPELCKICEQCNHPACYCKDFEDEKYLEQLVKDTEEEISAIYDEGIKELEEITKKSELIIDDTANSTLDPRHVDYKPPRTPQSTKINHIRFLDKELGYHLSGQALDSALSKSLGEKKAKLKSLKLEEKKLLHNKETLN